ncbi:quinone oxidoreductase family protein [Mangrovicella endophytica]|uniref:quinone oxidoreductase family protein n=1 Tax=Mangrovicella endophytica TaxID=2066697 RepID=UPI000C9EA869|nr:quinone oxidoreductase [Mangrovicella endophytica]
MTKAIVVHETGGPEVLRWEDRDPGRPGPGQILVRQTAVGLNFIDVYFRTGVYAAPKFPYVPGGEGAGVVEAVGEGVSDIAAGDRVAYCGASGTYAEAIVIDAAIAVPVPDAIDDATAASIMLKGMTAEYLLRRTFPVGPETVLLFHAAAGGVGLLAGQWAKHLGATVIGTAGSPEKCELARRHGYDHVIDYSNEDFVARVREITEGRGCDVVYDSVGKDTFPASLDCLRRRGLWASFGQSSGKLPPMDVSILSQKGSLFATRPTLFSYNVTREDLLASADALFDVVSSGAVKPLIGQRFKLSDAAEAHRALEGRRTIGATVLEV